MYRPNRLKRRLSDGKKALGCFSFTGDANAAEILALAGYDFLLIDHEHGPADLQSAIAILRATSATETTGLLRVPWNDPVDLKRALDTGIEGVMVPMIETGDDARAAVSACMYPPRGIRGCASPLVRASDYGLSNQDYLDTINDNLFIICQIESERAIENIPEIAAVDGVDALLIGPNDVAGSLGKAGRTSDADVLRLMERAETAVKESGKKLGSIPYGGLGWQDLFDRGYDMVLSGSDISLLRDAATAQIAAHRDRNG